MSLGGGLIVIELKWSGQDIRAREQIMFAIIKPPGHVYPTYHLVLDKEYRVTGYSLI